MTRELYNHQSAALERLPSTGGYLAFEQGLGKSLTAIHFALRHEYRRVLIVCPAVAIGVWESELMQEGIGGWAPRGSRAAKASAIRDECAGDRPDPLDGPYLILNYEALLDKRVEAAVRSYAPDLIIVDEAQKIKTATAKRSKALHRLCADTPTLALSGTPITRNLLDLYSQYKVIDKDIWGGASWTKFKNYYAIMGGYGGYEVVGFRNTTELKTLIRPFTVVARKEDTLDLPSKMFQRISVPLQGKDWSDYQTMAKTGVLESADWVTTNPLERALRLSQIVGLGKLSATSAFVDDLVEADEKVVLFYRFREEGRVLGQRLGVPNLNGDTPAGERTQLVEAFQADAPDSPRVFLAQVTSGSTAITLTAASHMVYHSTTWSYEDFAQSQDRIHRIGQDYPCNYYLMTGTGPKSGITVDHLVLNSIERKEDFAAMITKDPSLLLPV